MAYQPKSYRKFVATAATATLVASAVAPAALAASNFSDVAPKYKEAVDYLFDNGITKGKTEELFGTHQNITRGELAIWLTRALGLEEEAKEAAASGFADTAGTYYDGYVSVLKEAKVLDGLSADKFGVNDFVTRGQMAKLLSNAYGLTSDEAAPFTDMGQWAPFINGLYAFEITTGKTETTFGTAENITRGDLAIFMFRAEGTVVVDEAPVFNYEGQETIAVAYGAEFTAPVVTAEDDIDEEVEVVSVITDAAGNELQAIDTKKPGTYKITYTAEDSAENVSELVLTVVVAEAVTPAVESVSAINGTKLEVKFNKEVDANTISVSDFTIAALDNQTLTTNTLVGTLSADKKTYTIETAGGEFFNKRYDVKLAAQSVKSVDGKDVTKYETTINVNDTSAPVISSVSYAQAGAGKVDVTVTFDEQIGTLGTVNVNGAVVSPTHTQYSKSMTISGLDAGKTYKVDVLGTSDVAGNVANPLSTSIATSADATAPSVSVSVTNSTVKLDFSEEVQDSGANAFVVKVNGAGTFTAVQNGNDPTVYTVDVSSALGGSTFLNNAKIDVTSIYDLAGNKASDVSVTANILKDTVAPKFVSATVDGKDLVLKYDEAILDTSVTNIAATDLTIKLVDKDGVQHSLAANTDFTVTPAHGLDLNANGQIDAGTEEEKYVVVTLDEVANGKDFIDAAGKLVQGTYTVTVAKDQLTDATGNFVAATTFNVVAGAGTASKTVTYSATNTGLDNNQFKVLYSEDMSNDALLASKYTLGGVALPAGTTLTFVDNKQNVLVTLPEGYIAVTGPRVLTVTGVTAVDGDLQVATGQAQVTVNFKENVAPTATKLSIVSDSQAVVEFSEDVTGTSTGIKVKVNGVEVTPSTITNVGGDLQVNFAAGTLKLTDKVTVEFSGSDLADAAGNVIKNGAISN